MKLAAYFVSESDRFCQVGLEFNATTKAGNDRTFFWVSSRKDNPDRLYRWVPTPHNRSGHWKELAIATLGEKKRAELINCWQSQQDIGLWIAHSKRIAHFYELESV
jgi:hypothetical protein